jgi:3-polyprenyl-4-hydroxybenzoate decarboxylase
VRLIVGLTGATGTIYGVRFLERLREMNVETHLVISRWGARTLAHETPHTREYVESLATTVYRPETWVRPSRADRSGPTG